MARPVFGFSRLPVPCCRSEFGTAAFSRGHRYRWLLTRRFDLASPQIAANGERKQLIFIGLNPSTAGANRDDPTLRRLSGYAQTWGYQRLVVINLFALMTPSPSSLRRHPRPVGSANDAVLLHWLRRWAHQLYWDLWLGWGANGSLKGRDQWLLKHWAGLRRKRFSLGGGDALCLGRTRGGHPRHPLYLPSSLRPLPWLAAEDALIRHPEAKVLASTVRP